MDSRVVSRTRAPRAAPESPVRGDLSRALVTRRTAYPAGHHIEPHWHRRAQFAYGVEGTMRVRTARRLWIVPPTRALWIPAHTVHEIEMYGTVKMHSLYLDVGAALGMPGAPVVLGVTPLLRELVVRAVALPPDYDEAGDDGLIVRLLLAEMRHLEACAFDLPLPESGDLLHLCERILADLSVRRNCAGHAQEVGASARTLYRRFLRETGITFARWNQQARLLEAIRRLAEGAPVTQVAIDLGYESPSAFSTMFRRALGIAPRSFAGRDGRTVFPAANRG